MSSSPTDYSASSSTDEEDDLNNSMDSTPMDASDPVVERDRSYSTASPSDFYSNQNDDDEDGFALVGKKKETRLDDVERVSKNGDVNPNPVSAFVPNGNARETTDEEEPDHLHFPNNCKLSDMEKRRWFKVIYNKFGSKVALKNGVKRIFIICHDKEATRYLVENVIDGVKLVGADGRTRKIVILNFPIYHDENLFLENEHVKWVRRLKHYGEGAPKILAGIKGVLPKFIEDYPGEEFSNRYKVEIYFPPPMLCNKCSSWGHVFRDCKGSYRCRYCAGDHDSRICREKIGNGENIPRKCVNCGLSHNANSWACLRCPSQASGSSRPGAPRGLEPMAGDFPPLEGSAGGSGTGSSGGTRLTGGTDLSSDGVNSAGELNALMAMRQDAKLAWAEVVRDGVLGLRKEFEEKEEKLRKEVKEKEEKLGNEIKVVKDELIGVKNGADRYHKRLEELMRLVEEMKKRDADQRERIRELESMNVQVDDIENEEMLRVCAEVVNSALVPRGTTGKQIKSHIAYLRKNAPEHRLLAFRKAIYASRKFSVQVNEMMNKDINEYGNA